MPTQITKTYSMEALDAYYQALLKMVKTAGLLEKDSAEDFPIKITRQAWLAMVLNQFYTDYDAAQQAAAQVGLDEELTRPELRVLAQHLGKDYSRREYYKKTLKYRLRHDCKNEPEPLTLIELEQRYQHYLWRKARRKKDLGLGPLFDTWRYTDDCRTFYDEL